MDASASGPIATTPTAGELEPAAPPSVVAPHRGPATGLVYAGTWLRVAAFAIDIVVVLLLSLAVVLLVSVLSLPVVTGITTVDRWLQVLSDVLGAIVGLAYFVVGWHRFRGTLGQRMLGIMVGNASDGANLGWGAAVIRWAALTLSPVSWIVPGEMFTVMALVWLIWFIALVVTTAESPTKQGLHDRWAGSLVVRRA